MAPFHVRSEVCIAPIHVRSKVCQFARHMDGSNADFALHMEGSHADRDAKRYQRANNVGVKKILSGVKSLPNLRCFVGKVNNDAISCFLVAFFSSSRFASFCYFLAFFLHYLGLLGLLCCFVTN